MILDLVFLEFVSHDEFVNNLVGLGRDDMFIVYLEVVFFIERVASEGHDAHSCEIVCGVDAEILRLVVVLDDEVVHASHCLHEVGQSAAVVRRRLVHEFVINEGPNSLILVHVRSDVKVD